MHSCPPGTVSKYLYELNVAELRGAFALYTHPCASAATPTGWSWSPEPSAGGGDVRRDTIGKGRHGLDPKARHIVAAGP